MVTHSAVQEANRRSAEMENRVPKAIAAKYDRHLRRVVIHLSSNLGIFFSPRDAEGLQGATPEQLSRIEISPSGYGLHFPDIDADLYLPALLEGVFGSERWTANHMGRLGGRSTSIRKREGARANGTKGALPRLKKIGSNQEAARKASA